MWGQEHSTLAQLLPEPHCAALHKGQAHICQHRHSLQCSLFMNRTIFSWSWSYPLLPRVLQEKSSPFPTRGWRGSWHRNRALLYKRRVWVTTQLRNICYNIDLFRQTMKFLLCLSFLTCEIHVSTWKQHSFKFQQHFRDEKLKAGVYIIWRTGKSAHTAIIITLSSHLCIIFVCLLQILTFLFSFKSGYTEIHFGFSCCMEILNRIKEQRFICINQQQKTNLFMSQYLWQLKQFKRLPCSHYPCCPFIPDPQVGFMQPI